MVIIYCISVFSKIINYSKRLIFKALWQSIIFYIFINIYTILPTNELLLFKKFSYLNIYSLKEIKFVSLFRFRFKTKYYINLHNKREQYT